MCCFLKGYFIAGWSSPVARQAHNLKVVGSNPAPATTRKGLEMLEFSNFPSLFCLPFSMVPFVACLLVTFGGACFRGTSFSACFDCG